MKRILTYISVIILMASCGENETVYELSTNKKNKDMVLPTTIINSEDVRVALGASNNKWSHLCTHPNINPLSRWKPVRYNTVNAITEANLKAVNWGISFEPSNTYQEASNKGWSYLRPRGSLYNEPFRLGDFRGYNKYADTDVCSGYKSGFTVDIVDLNSGITFGQQLSVPSGSITMADLNESPFAYYYFSVILENSDGYFIAKSAPDAVYNGGKTVTFTKAELTSNAFLDRPLIAHVVLSYNSYNSNTSGGTYYSVCDLFGYLNRVPITISNTLNVSFNGAYYLNDIPGSIYPLTGSQMQVNDSYVVALTVTNNYSSYSFPVSRNTFKFINTDFFGNRQQVDVPSYWGTNDGIGSTFRLLSPTETLYVAPGQTVAFAYKHDFFLRGQSPPANGTTVTTDFVIKTLWNNADKIVYNTIPVEFKLNINL